LANISTVVGLVLLEQVISQTPVGPPKVLIAMALVPTILLGNTSNVATIRFNIRISLYNRAYSELKYINFMT
jgi:hypothetical protein